MIPSASVLLITERSASKMVSTKMMRTGASTCGLASATAPAVPSCTCCSMKTPGMPKAVRACASTFSLRCPVMYTTWSTFPRRATSSIT
ncbi:MAG TPA: hypothetical protein PKC83_12455 [Gemmatimonadaceae bacterium]|nr:hypothetical protein [Gemmatimonadaceae bacterium]